MSCRATELAGDTHWKVINLADVVPTPWKNGGGTTRELIAWPDAEHWVWRMSVAEVAQSGPFSRFEGVQRWFAVLGGAGVALTHNGTRHGMVVIARDQGPGIGDVDALLSGPSTAGGPGLGLPGVRRVVDEFQIVSERNLGTTVTAIKWKE